MLSDIEWKEFTVDKVFDIYTGATIRQSELGAGKIPRITATDVKNGVGLFTDTLSNKNYRTLNNCITISFLGSVFYQDTKISLDMKIHAIKIKGKELNKYTALFLIPSIKNFSLKYNYGYQLSTSVLKSQKILLPINKHGEPDREFMENYMKEIEQELIQKTVGYFKNRLNEDVFKESRGVNTKQWREFEIGTLFAVKIGKNIDGNKIDKNG